MLADSYDPERPARFSDVDADFRVAALMSPEE